MAAGSPPRGVQALTIALHGTLVDRDTGIVEALRPWAERHHLAANTSALLEAFARHEPRRLRENPDMRHPDVMELVFADIVRDLGRTPTGADAAAFGEAVSAWPVFDEAAPALRRLARAYRIAIVANTDRPSYIAAGRQLGVEPDVLVTAEDAGAYKPDRAPFDLVLDRLSEIGIGFDAVAHVGQSRYHDIDPAAALGMTTCWIDRDDEAGGGAWGATPPGDRRVAPTVRHTSLTALADALAAD